VFDRREERRQERRGAVEHFQMRKKLVAIGDDSWIENEAGERVFKVNGKAMRIRETLDFEDAHGNVLLRIHEKKLRLRSTMEIEDPRGHTVATVKQAALTPMRERLSVSREHGPDLDVHGNILDHEYSIEADGHKVAEVSKRWFRVADTYGVEITDGQDEILLLAVTAVIDSMTHEG
jgi:uncharacterized protein YxjI